MEILSKPLALSERENLKALALSEEKGEKMVKQKVADPWSPEGNRHERRLMAKLDRLRAAVK